MTEKLLLEIPLCQLSINTFAFYIHLNLRTLGTLQKQVQKIIL